MICIIVSSYLYILILSTYIYIYIPCFGSLCECCLSYAKKWTFDASVRLCVDRFPFPVPSPGEETNGRKQIQIIVKYSVTRCTGGRGGDVGIKIPEALSVHPRVFFLLRGFRYFTSRVFFFFWGGAGETSGCGNSGIREEQATKNCEKDEKTKTFSGSFSNISRTLSAYMNVVLRSSMEFLFHVVWIRLVKVCVCLKTPPSLQEWHICAKVQATSPSLSAAIYEAWTLNKKQHATLHLSQWAWVKKNMMH